MNFIEECGDLLNLIDNHRAATGLSVEGEKLLSQEGRAPVKVQEEVRLQQVEPNAVGKTLRYVDLPVCRGPHRKADCPSGSSESRIRLM